MKPTHTFTQSKLCVLNEVIKCKVRLKLLVITFSESITRLVCLALLDIVTLCVLRRVHFQSVEQVCIVTPVGGKLCTNQWQWLRVIFLCDIFEDVDTYCTLTAMYLGNGVMVYLSILNSHGCTAARTCMVRHWYEAFSSSQRWHFKRAVLRSFESHLFILSSKQFSEVALLEPQTWHVF